MPEAFRRHAALRLLPPCSAAGCASRRRTRFSSLSVSTAVHYLYAHYSSPAALCAAPAPMLMPEEDADYAAGRFQPPQHYAGWMPPHAFRLPPATPLFQLAEYASAFTMPPPFRAASPPAMPSSFRRL
jgi:hypothetical protein